MTKRRSERETGPVSLAPLDLKAALGGLLATAGKPAKAPSNKEKAPPTDEG